MKKLNRQQVFANTDNDEILNESVLRLRFNAEK